MESAIAQHLQGPRARHRRISDDYNPPYPSIVARFDPAVTRVVMAYFGVQYKDERDRNGATKALEEIAGAFGSDRGASSWDRATYVDETGFLNTISVGYLARSQRFRRLVRAPWRRLGGGQRRGKHRNLHGNNPAGRRPF